MIIALTSGWPSITSHLKSVALLRAKPARELPLECRAVAIRHVEARQLKQIGFAANPTAPIRAGARKPSLAHQRDALMTVIGSAAEWIRETSDRSLYDRLQL